MFIIHVFCHVKPDKVEEFKASIIENARNSIQEPGIARFDVIQQADDPTRFVLAEAYRSQEDNAKHRETAHYKKWAALATELLAEPRSRIVYNNVFPDEQGWG